MPAHDWTRVTSGIFHHFHQAWILELNRSLNSGMLPEGFYALTEQVAEGPQPDVLALEFQGNGGKGAPSRGLSGGAVVALSAQPPRVKYVERAEREVYARSADRVAIYHASGDRVVAYIEIVSPGNKHSQFELNKFLAKLDEALERGCHLLIVDLHPPGRCDPRGIHAAFWERRMGEAHGVTPDQPLGLSAYRSDVVPTAWFEPIAVGQLLPDMPLFITPDHYVDVPLEGTYAAAWQSVPRRWTRVVEQGDSGTG